MEQRSVSLSYDQLLALKDYSEQGGSERYSAFARGKGPKPDLYDALISIFESDLLSSVPPGLTLYRGISGVNLALDEGADNPEKNVMSTSVRMDVA